MKLGSPSKANQSDRGYFSAHSYQKGRDQIVIKTDQYGR